MASVPSQFLRQVSPAPFSSDMPEIPGVALRIFDKIEPGFGIVPVVGEYAGSHLIEAGEVAVYDESWHDQVSRGQAEFEPGLYCYEKQRAPHCLPNRMIADRFADNDPVKMVIERMVVVVTRHPRAPEHWAYRELRSKLHRGVRVPSRLEGPIYDWAMPLLLLGPIVGIYRPRFAGGHK